MMKFCPRCGRQIRNDAVVCPYCGYQLTQTPEPDSSNSSRDYGDQADSDGNSQPDEPDRIKYSKAKLTPVDFTTLAFNVLNAATLLFLGCQGLLSPDYINNVGTFITVILSMLSIMALCVEIHQNLHNRLPIVALVIALLGNVSVFVMVLMFDQVVFLISFVAIMIALLIFDRELKRTY